MVIFVGQRNNANDVQAVDLWTDHRARGNPAYEEGDDE